MKKATRFLAFLCVSAMVLRSTTFAGEIGRSEEIPGMGTEVVVPEESGQETEAVIPEESGQETEAVIPEETEQETEAVIPEEPGQETEAVASEEPEQETEAVVSEEIEALDSGGNGGIVDASAFSYKITPILSPFTYYLYVQTDNPDPTSFRLQDENSVFFTAEDKGNIYANPNSSISYVNSVDPGIYYIDPIRYMDVVYEDKAVGRVAGGYIFRHTDCYSDGGEFILLQKVASGSSLMYDEFKKTSIKISCSPLETRSSYLIKTYTTDKADFFEKLNAVQSFLNQYAVYPNNFFDVNKPSKDLPYPLLASSPYPELGLNEHYNMYEYSSEVSLLSGVYPFILDSASFPGIMSKIARELKPECEVVGGNTHAYIDVKYNGESRSYGGAGEGGSTPLRSDRLPKLFTFRENSEMGFGSTLEDYRTKLMGYKATADEDIREYEELILGDTFRQTIRNTGGTWIRIATEGWFGYGRTYGYAVPLESSVRIASKAWVDGKYINEFERVELNVGFEEHPTADIIKHNVSYTDINGKGCTQDVIYSYNEEEDNWTAPYFYTNSYWYSEGTVLPPELILSRQEAEALVKGGNGSQTPAKGLIYDGTESPGTPFHDANVTGITVDGDIVIREKEGKTLTAKIEPPDAFEKRVVWTSSNENIATVDNDWITGRAAGTAVITARTVDGGYTDTLTVTVNHVLPAAYEFNDTQHWKTCSACKEVLNRENHIWDGEKDTTCNTCGYERALPSTPQDKVFGNKTKIEVIGTGRTETSIELANQMKKALGIKQFNGFILASGADYPDGLGVSALSIKMNAPVLIVMPGTETKVKDYIKTNLAVNGEVIISGGPGAVRKEMEDSLKGVVSGITVERLGGIGRYETNMKTIEKCLAKEASKDELLVASGKGYADALSASATGKIIMIVGDKLRDDQKALLKKSGFGKITILGGEGAVSKAVENELKTVTGKTVGRIGGIGRIETSDLVARRYFPGSQVSVYTKADGFADGLAGGLLAHTLGAPMRLAFSGKDMTAPGKNITLGGVK